MTRMHVYHISMKDLGDEIILEPKIPDIVAFGEDDHTKRICVSPSILGCLRSVQPINQYTPQEGLNEKKPEITRAKFYLYEAKVKCKNLYQPTKQEVPDVYVTNEFWVMSPTLFTKVSDMHIIKQYDFPNSCFSRYAVCPVDGDVIMDRIISLLEYSETLLNFSYVEFNSARAIIEDIDTSQYNIP